MKVSQKETRVSNESYDNYVGLEVFKVLAVNPTRKELNKIYDREDSETDEELEYVSTTDDGVDKVRINFILKGITSNKIFTKSFLLIDEERTNKDGTKTQYVNQICQTAWADSEENLPDWFTKFIDFKTKKVTGEKLYRVCKKGEGDFYEFVKFVMNKANYNADDIEFDWKKLLKSNFSQLNEYLSSGDYGDPFALIAYIKDVETAEGVVQYNEVFTKSSLSLDMFNQFTRLVGPYYKQKVSEIKEDEDLISKYGLENIEELSEKDIYGYVNSPDVIFKKEWESKNFKRFVDSLKGEYGCNGFYKVSPTFKYNVNMSITSGSASISDDSSDY